MLCTICFPFFRSLNALGATCQVACVLLLMVAGVGDERRVAASVACCSQCAKDSGLGAGSLFGSCTRTLVQGLDGVIAFLAGFWSVRGCDDGGLAHGEWIYFSMAGSWSATVHVVTLRNEEGHSERQACEDSSGTL